MVGAYIAFYSTSSFGLPAWLSVIVAMAFCTLLGIIIERLAYKPLRGATSLAVLITAIGVSYFLQNAALLAWGSAPKVFTSLFAKIESFKFFDGQLVISPERFLRCLPASSLCWCLLFSLQRQKWENPCGPSLKITELLSSWELMLIPQFP